MPNQSAQANRRYAIEFVIRRCYNIIGFGGRAPLRPLDPPQGHRGRARNCYGGRAAPVAEPYR